MMSPLYKDNVLQNFNPTLNEPFGHKGRVFNPSIDDVNSTCDTLVKFSEVTCNQKWTSDYKKLGQLSLLVGLCDIIMDENNGKR